MPVLQCTCPMAWVRALRLYLRDIGPSQLAELALGMPARCNHRIRYAKVVAGGMRCWR
jgi:hypothetical protein